MNAKDAIEIIKGVADCLAFLALMFLWVVLCVAASGYHWE